jgi:hypothetical protein
MLPLLAMCALVSQAHTQTVSSYIHPPTGAQCAAADQTLRTGDIAQVDSQLAAFGTASGCVDGTQAIAVAMQRRRAAAMTRDMYTVFTPTAGDTALLRVALDLASDVGAGLAARVMSLRLLLAYVGSNALLGYGDVSGVLEGDFCIPGPPVEGSLYSRSNLSADTPQQVRQRAVALERDPAQPAHVRSAANCVMNAWRTARGLPTQLLLSNPQPALTLEYICGKRFRIKNTLAYQVVTQYEVAGVTERKLLYLTSKKPGQTYGETQLDLDTSGELRLLLDGDVILTAANGGTTCP